MDRQLKLLIGLTLLAIGAMAALVWQFVWGPRAFPAVELVTVQTGFVSSTAAVAEPAVVRSCQTSELTSDRDSSVINVAVGQGDRVTRGDVIMQLEGSVVARQLPPQQVPASVQYDLASGCASEAASGPRSIDTLRRSSVAEAARRLGQPLVRGNSHGTSCKKAEERAQAAPGNRQELLARNLPLPLLAPYDGYVTELAVRNGQEVTRGSMLARVVDASCLFVRVRVPSHLSAQQRDGASVQACLRFPALAEPSDCTSQWVRAMEVGAGGKESRIELKDLPPGVKPGSNVYVRFKLTAAPDATRIPIRALLEDRQSVFLFDEQHGTVSRRALTLGLRGDEYAEVLSGVTPGQRIVMSTPGTRAILQDGDRVRPSEPESTRPATSK